jgi:hypothetical protein
MRGVGHVLQAVLDRPLTELAEATLPVRSQAHTAPVINPFRLAVHTSIVPSARTIDQVKDIHDKAERAKMMPRTTTLIPTRISLC